MLHCPSMMTSKTDCWITCFWGDKAHSTYDDPITGWKTPIAGNKDSFTIRRFKIIDEVINTAIANGNIIIPEDEFDAGFDHLTPIVRSEDIESKADPNYYLKRGYPGNVNSLSVNILNPIPIILQQPKKHLSAICK